MINIASTALTQLSQLHYLLASVCETLNEAIDQRFENERILLRLEPKIASFRTRINQVTTLIVDIARAQGSTLSISANCTIKE